MFNPQRKSKVADIYMQEKAYQHHLQKMADISRKLSPPKRYDEQQQQNKYLNQLHMSKKQVQVRLSADVKRQNQRILSRLIETDGRKEYNPQSMPSRRHFNSYFSSKKEDQRIKNENYTMIVRMVNRSSEIPSLKQMKQEYRKNKRLSKKCRKLPSIIRHQNQFKNKLSMGLLQSVSSSRDHQSRGTNLNSH